MTIHRDTQLNDEQQAIYTRYRGIDMQLERLFRAYRDMGEDELARSTEQLQIDNARTCGQILFDLDDGQFTAGELHEFVANAFAEWASHNEGVAQ